MTWKKVNFKPEFALSELLFHRAANLSPFGYSSWTQITCCKQEISIYSYSEPIFILSVEVSLLSSRSGNMHSLYTFHMLLLYQHSHHSAPSKKGNFWFSFKQTHHTDRDLHECSRADVMASYLPFFLVFMTV